MEFKTLTIQDYEALLDLWQRAGLSTRPRGRDSYDNMQAEMVANPTGFIGVADEGKLVGFVLATFDGRKGWINRVAVDPDWRRHGLGLKLIGEAERNLQERGAKIIAALIEDWNHPSVKLFEKAGYVIDQTIIYASKRESKDT